MKILVACEESQAVCKEFRAKGHEAYSCDILECSGGHPEWHINKDVLPLLNGDCTFKTVDGTEHSVDGKWDMIIAFPPCTYLTVTQNWCYDRERFGDEYVDKRLKEREWGISFFLRFANADCDRIAIENPVGCMNTIYKKPSQIIQPYFFGDKAKKTTCLWLKGLPKLEATDMVEPGAIFVYYDPKTGRKKQYPKWMYEALGKPKAERQRLRSKTFPGVAKAMAEQWG